MGSREDRLDALLAALVSPPLEPPDVSLRATTDAPGQTAVPMDPHLAPLLEAAQDLAQFADARPDTAFAARLGQRMLVRAEQRRQDVASFKLEGFADGLALQRHVTARDMARVDRVRPWSSALQSGVVRRGVIAALMLVALGIGAWTVAMAFGAAPGTAFYGLHEIGQNIGLTFMNQQERAQAHIQAARQWLEDLRVEASGQGDSTAYSATLSALLGEDAAAAQAIQQMAPGAVRDGLNADLASLRTDERTGLRAALQHIGWSDRIATTQALTSLGATVPHVTGATVTQLRGLWQVTLQGSGFEPGAVLLIDGKPAGSVTAVTGTTLTARAPSGLLKAGTVVLGVGNPDGTAATTSSMVLLAAPTATPNGHGNGNGNGNGNGGKGNGGHGNGSGGGSHGNSGH